MRNISVKYSLMMPVYAIQTYIFRHNVTATHHN